MGHFFEKYRLGLANSTPTFHHAQSLPLPLLPPSSRIERGTLRKNYNVHTAQRVCLTYHLLNDILAQKIHDIGAAFRVQVSYLMLSLSEPTYHICTFCGLEMLKDILTHPRTDDRLSFIMSHYIKTTPAVISASGANIRVVAFHPSVLGPRLSWATMKKLLMLLPMDQILKVSLIRRSGLPPLSIDDVKVMKEEFLEYLKSYEGEEPKLGN